MKPLLDAGIVAILAGCASAPGRSDAPGEFHLELLAREPLVSDPVDLAYDENGRAYVVEMRDYPLPVEPGAGLPRPLGRVRLLEDLDGDGRFDRSTVFAEPLHWPTSVAPWRGGVFVLAPPDLWYFKDVDGDRRADVRRLVLSGFGHRNVQALANNLKWGLDNRIYGAGSGEGGEINGVSLRRRDFSFDPASGELRAEPGGARFGNTFDDWGNRFICNIRNPIQHVVLPARALDAGGAGTAVRDAAESGEQVPVYRASPPEAWREERARRWAIEAQPMPRSELVGTGFFTSACAATVYRGSAYPPSYRGNVFLGEVAGNLVHRQILEPDGVSFRARRADVGREFIASTEPWFRPVNFVNAPDGTLHLLDMRRETIEHPWSIPDDIRARLDLLKGNDEGRIYRIAPPGFRPPPPPRLGGASLAELVGHLEHADAWWRETAQRLIVEREDTAAVGPLRRLLKRSSVPLARLHALWTLAGLKALDAGDLGAARSDPDPGVREHAVRIGGNADALAKDPSPRVRFQVALSRPGLEAMEAIARRDSGNPFTRAALLSSAAGREGALLAGLAADGGVAVEFLRDLASAVRRPEEAEEALSRCPPERRFAVASGLLEGLGPAGRAGGALQGVLEEARRRATQTGAPDRVSAIALLRHDAFEHAFDALRAGLDSRQPAEVQRAAVRTLGTFNRPEIPEILLQLWREQTPSVRGDALDVLVSRAAWIPRVLDAIESGALAVAQMPSDRRNRLENHPDPALRERAIRLLGPKDSRAEAVRRFRGALALAGDASRGRRVFRRACVACHSAGGEGHAVGPDLSTVRHRSAEEILLHVLDPNREVSPAYVGFLVRLKDGRDVAGIIVAESGGRLTLRSGGGTEVTVLREDVEKIASLGLSLMPEGLEAGLDLRQMADLLVFLKQGAAP